MSYKDRYKTDGESLSIVDPDEWSTEEDNDEDEDEDRHPCFVPKEDRE